MPASLTALYPAHLASVRQHADEALARHGFDHLLIAAGTPPGKFLDDQDLPFAVSPYFKHWLPLTQAPGSWIVHAPGARPRLVFVQPNDYWNAVPETPRGYWVDAFDIVIVRSASEAVAQLPHGHDAIIAPAGSLDRDGLNPPAVLDHLAWHRSFKTPYELELMREANRIGTRAHLAARAAFRAGKSEFDIHLAYLAAARQTDAELPYGNIVALNEHGAVLHYMVFDHTPPARHRSFLIDAGASCAGYAADITRTCAAPDAPEFQALIDSLDTAQQGFVAKVRAGQNYAELHLHAHYVVAGILREHGFLRMSADSAVESGVTAAFLPHGLGHLIGANVHDVAGFQVDERGGRIDPPAGHPYLRQTRTLAPGMVTTIEPGIYFIDMLLAKLRDKPCARDIDWAKVDHFRQFGGIRIEDDVVCTSGAPENLTRDAFAQPQ